MRMIYLYKKSNVTLGSKRIFEPVKIGETYLFMVCLYGIEIRRKALQKLIKPQDS